MSHKSRLNRSTWRAQSVSTEGKGPTVDLALFLRTCDEMIAGMIAIKATLASNRLLRWFPGRYSDCFEGCLMIRTLALVALCAPAPAAAAEAWIGLNAAVVADLPDPVSREYAKFGIGPSLQIPVRVMFGERVGLRITPRFQFAAGADRVTWVRNVDGREVRFYDDDHKAYLLGGALTIGPEVAIPVNDTVAPYFGAEAGAGWIGTYHSLGGESVETQHLLDPAQNDLGSPQNIDPYTSQIAFATDFHAGMRLTLNDGFRLFIEGGYESSYVGAQPLQKTAAEYKAMREAYGWNALRGSVGVAFSL